MRHWVLIILMLTPLVSTANEPGARHFEQLDDVLPTPSETRLATGAPGPKYWQQRADYKIKVTVDDTRQHLDGWEEITYHNRSPHTLDYLWVQLDQNSFRKGSARSRMSNAPSFKKFSYRHFRSLLGREVFEGGVNIESVTDGWDRPLPHTIVETMMRIDLKKPLRSGKTMSLRIKWNHNINNARQVWGRGGYEFFEEDENHLYTIAQWFPRMAVYNDVRGWQNKPFIGRGEFTLELGDYEVAITVPADHIVAATGELQNARRVLSASQRQRLKKAKASDEPVWIVTKEEAAAASKSKSTQTKTWRFRAKNVRDFAFATSRRFLWDAMGATSDGKRVMCMSFYPPEAEPTWFRYSSQSIAHTLEVYGRLTFPYPYPVAISVNGPIGGMEYPMISFNGPRAEKDGTYYARSGENKRWDRSKYGLISVIIHEVGHNWFPMIINSDERQWTWMDEGLNTFVQRVAELEWEEDYPSWRGKPQSIVGYMKSTDTVPIMTNSESLLRFGSNAYAKPAAALTVLRESIMGRPLFDHAFKTYTNRWKFKQPQPADFFRTMEDVSGMDLDWFWRGWFYTTGHVDLGIKRVRRFIMDVHDPVVDKPAKKAFREANEPPNVSQDRNVQEGRTYRVERYPNLKDFYNNFDPDAVTERDKDDFQKYLKDLKEWEKELLKKTRFFYVIDLENKGLVMPVPLHITYKDGGKEVIKYPAEIWAKRARSVSKLLMTKREVASFEIDPHKGLADVDHSNNAWPPKIVESRFKLFKKKFGKNEMQKAKAWKEKKQKEAAKAKAKEEAQKKEKQRELKNDTGSDGSNQGSDRPQKAEEASAPSRSRPADAQ